MRTHLITVPMLLLGLTAPAAAQLKVVTSTSDLYDIARQIGGTRIKAKHISEGYQDPHFVEAKPSFVLDLQKADVWAFVGLDLEVGWMSLLLDGARNPRIRMGGTGYLDVSRGIPVLDLPSGAVDRSQGDVHALGNPHYWLDPANGGRIAALFKDRFAELDPAGAGVYAANLARFQEALDLATKGWAADLASLKDKPIVAWVPPSPSHLAGLIQTVKRTGAKAIVMEPYYDRKTADFVAAKTGAVVVMLPPSVGGQKGLDDYLSVISYNIQTLAKAIR